MFLIVLFGGIKGWVDLLVCVKDGSRWVGCMIQCIGQSVNFNLNGQEPVNLSFLYKT